MTDDVSHVAHLSSVLPPRALERAACTAGTLDPPPSSSTALMSTPDPPFSRPLRARMALSGLAADAKNSPAKPSKSALRSASYALEPSLCYKNAVRYCLCSPAWIPEMHTNSQRARASGICTVYISKLDRTSSLPSRENTEVLTQGSGQITAISMARLSKLVRCNN